MHYTGKLIDGTVFDSSVERGQPATFPLNQVIKCWTEGVQQMKVGGKAKLVCPADVAYGDRGAPPKIKPGSTLDVRRRAARDREGPAPGDPAARGDGVRRRKHEEVDRLGARAAEARRRRSARRRQMLRLRLATPSAASLIASGSVGCACTVRAMSSRSRRTPSRAPPRRSGPTRAGRGCGRRGCGRSWRRR